MKIFPIYWINLVLLIIWGAFVYKLGYPSTFTYYHLNLHLSIITLVFFIFSNILILGLDLFFLFGINKNGTLFFTKNFNATNPTVYNFAFNFIAWTVSTELLFYILAPFLLRKKLVVIILIILGSLLLRIILARFGLISVPWDYMFFPTQLMFFFSGALSYHLYLLFKKKVISRRILKGIFCVYLSIICLYYVMFTESYWKQIFLFVSTVVAIPFIFINIKKDPIDVLLAELSYPIYISQALFIKITAISFMPKPFGQGFTTLLLDITFSFFLLKVIINPIEKFRKNRIKLQPEPILFRD